MQPDTEKPHVTVVVCTRDRPGLLDNCLRSLLLQAYPAFDVLVVDNSESYSAKNLCRLRSVAWVPAPLPGLTIARNLGARAARGEYIAYIDDDAVAEAGWLEALMEGFRDPAVACVTGRVRYMKAVGDTRAISGDEGEGSPARPAARFDSSVDDWFALACFGGVGDGGNMAFRRSVVITEVAFDERLGRGRRLDSGDEHVVFASLISRGHRIVHRPAAVVRHPCPPTPELRQERRFFELRSSIAYLAFLWNEFPVHRAEIARFIRRAVVRRLAPARGQPHLPRARALWSVMAGFAVYLMAKREWSGAAPRRGSEHVAPPPGLIESGSGSH